MGVKALIGNGTLIGLVALGASLFTPFTPTDTHTPLNGGTSVVRETGKQLGGNRKDCNDKIVPQYRIATAYPDEERIGLIVSQLEKVPDSIQRIANANGHQTVIVDRPVNILPYQLGWPEFPKGSNFVFHQEGDGTNSVITYNESMLGGVTLKSTKFNRSGSVTVTIESDNLGVYSKQTKTAIVPQKSTMEELSIELGIREVGNTALHEYGHLVDDATNRQSGTENFLSVYGISLKRYVEQHELEREKRSLEGFKKSGTRTVGGEPIDNVISRYQVDPSKSDAFRKLFPYITHHELGKPTEFFAGVFSAYYDGPKSKRALREAYPEAYQFIVEWENNISSRDCESPASKRVEESLEQTLALYPQLNTPVYRRTFLEQFNHS